MSDVGHLNCAYYIRFVTFLQMYEHIINQYNLISVVREYGTVFHVFWCVWPYVCSFGKLFFL